MASTQCRPVLVCALVFLLLGQGVAVRPPVVGQRAEPEAELGAAAAEPDGSGQLVELGASTKQVALTFPGGIIQLNNQLARIAKEERRGKGVCSKVRKLIQAIQDMAKEALYTWIETGYQIAILEQPWLAGPSYAGPYSENFFPIRAVAESGGGAGFNHWYEVKLAWSATHTAVNTIRDVVEGTVPGSVASLGQFVPVVGLVLTALNCVTSFCDLFKKVKEAWKAAKSDNVEAAIKKRLVCEAVVDGARVLVGLMFTALGIAATVGTFGAAALAIPIMNVAWDAGSHYAGEMSCDWLARQANGGKRDKGGVLAQGVVSGMRTLGEIGEEVIEDDDVDGGEENMC